MPRYFFHVRSGEDVETDNVGVDLSGHDEAKDEARRTAGEMLRDGTLHKNQVLEVADAGGNVILKFTCSDVEEVR